MTTRPLFAALVLAGLTAFAPAPLPRSQRGKGDGALSLSELQGTWTVTKLQMTRGNGQLTDSRAQMSQVRISGDRWSFVYGTGPADVNYTIRVDHRLRPPQLDFYRLTSKDTEPYGVGILRRDGDSVQLVYTWGGSRAASFESPPEGHWLITLRRAP
jgi:uncharacterized protein (TIGR03067 family)